LPATARVPTIAAVNERPAGVADAEVAAALRLHWGLAVTRLEYLPVGYGGYHWAASVAGGQRFFVTLSPVPGDHGFAELAAAMSAAASLADSSHLNFVIGPVRTTSGQAAARLQPDWAVTVTPFAEGEPGRWGDELSAGDLAELTSILASLHSCDAPAGTPVRNPGLLRRDLMEALLGEPGGSWFDAGPYGEPARELIAEHAAGLHRSLGIFDDLVGQATASGAPALTHGEPHPGNLIRGDGSFLLVDWDTAGLALPERDLWWVLPDPDTDPVGFAASANLYTDLTGRAVDPAAVALYRMRWDLDDISLFLTEFRAPHQRTADTEKAWTGLDAAVRRVSRAVTGPNATREPP
jgi:spectinomycin phosphotransferase